MDKSKKLLTSSMRSMITLQIYRISCYKYILFLHFNNLLTLLGKVTLITDYYSVMVEGKRAMRRASAAHQGRVGNSGQGSQRLAACSRMVKAVVGAVQR